MLATYHFCVHQQQCPVLPKLPTISNTFDNAPGNYLSRFVISHVALAMALIQWVIWNPLSTQKCQKLTLGLGIFACVCFSFVGAICDDNTNPQCMGNNKIHSISAVTFFVLYNINMIILSCHKKKSMTSRCHHNAMLLLTIISTLTKVRFILPSVVPHGSIFATNVGDQTPLAVFEWTDTFTIIGWTVFYITKNRSNFYLQLRVEDSTTTTTDKLAVRFSLNNIAWAVLLLSTFTFTSCYYFLNKAGRIPKGSWPYISDMFVHPPGNWISRWTLVFGSTLSGFTQVCLYYLDGKTTMGDKMLTIVSLISVLGLSGVGCINEKENHTLHIICAGTFFIGYDLFMILRTLRQTISKWNIFTACLGMMSCVLTWLRFSTSGHQFLINHVSTSERVGAFLGPVLEWCDAILIINYLAFSIFAHGKTNVQNYGLVIVSDETGDVEDVLAVPLTKSVNYSQLI
jgi:hypothetical membrane protein